MRKLLYAAVGLGVLILGAGLHYALPRDTTAQIVGVEVKRVDGETGSRDVYRIQAQDPETQAVRVFRNEDAILYFKLNSADLQARAAALSRGDELRTVTIRSYGWRIPILSVFPNALSLREADAARRGSLLNVLIIAGILLVPGALVWRVRAKRQARPAPRGRMNDAGSAPARPEAEETMAWLSMDDKKADADKRSGSDQNDGADRSGSGSGFSEGSGSSGGSGGGSDA